MALGIHSFFACGHSHRDMGDYFIGSYIGDHYTNDDFAAMIKRIQKRLTNALGFKGWLMTWSPAKEKASNPLTDLQKYKRMVTREYNRHRKKVDELIKANTLFVDDFIEEETLRLHNRIAIFKKRYKIE